MRNLLILSLLWLVCGCTEKIAPTKSSIFGVVKDAETSQPLVGCNVMLVPSGRSTTTGADGVFHFDDIYPDQYSVEATKNGYYNNHKSVIVAAGERSNVDILLTRYDPENRLPTLGSITISDLTYNSVRVESEVVDQGSSSVSERGFIYSEIPNPTLSNGIRKSVQSGTGVFSTPLIGLKEQTKYYVVSYAINSRGTAYCNEQYTFTTLKQGEVPQPTNVIFVSVAGSDSNDGSSWSKAKKTIGAAVNEATSGKEIWVSIGSYNESVEPKDGIPIYGGFKGNEAATNDRNDRTSVSDITCGVYTTPTIINGFSISNSTNVAAEVTLRDYAMLQNCLISGNRFDVVSVTCRSKGAQMENCIIENNTTNSYGAIIEVESYDGALTMINCIFRGNQGGIESCNNLALYGCVIANNSYGIRMSSDGHISKLVNCTIASNLDFGVAAQKPTDMYNCLIWNNSIVEKLYGSSDGVINRYACKEISTADNSAVRFSHPSSTKGPTASDWETADWSILAGSNCVNAGVSLYFPMDEIPTDIAGAPRIIGSSIDIGAYEY